MPAYACETNVRERAEVMSEAQLGPSLRFLYLSEKPAMTFLTSCIYIFRWGNGSIERKFMKVNDDDHIFMICPVRLVSIGFGIEKAEKPSPFFRDTQKEKKVYTTFIIAHFCRQGGEMIGHRKRM